MPTQLDPEYLRLALATLDAGRTFFPREPVSWRTFYTDPQDKLGRWEHWEAAGKFKTVFFETCAERYPVAQAALACAATHLVQMLHAVYASASGASVSDLQKLLDGSVKEETGLARGWWEAVWVKWKSVVDEFDIALLGELEPGYAGRPPQRAEMLMLLEDYLDLVQAVGRLATAAD